MGQEVQEKSFDLIDLPREIRDRIYHFSLCSFDRQNDPGTSVDILEYSTVEAEIQGFDMLKFSGHINLLCVSKQIYHEAYTYMVKTNQFVRVEYYGFYGVNMGPWLYGSSGSLPTAKVTCVPPKAKDYCPVALFRGYHLHLRLGVDDHPGSPEWDIMVLGKHLDEFCRSFDIERAVQTNSLPLQVEAIVNPSKWSWDDPTSFAEGHASMPLSIQKGLLAPICQHIRGFPDFVLSGVDNEDLIQHTQNAVSLHRWESSQHALTVLQEQEILLIKSWDAGDYANVARACASGLYQLRRVQECRQMRALAIEGGTHFLNENARLASKFRFKMAQCLHFLALENLENRDIVQYSSRRMIHHLLCCLHAHDDLGGFGISITWYHTDEEAGEVFRHLAESLRLGLGGPWNDDQIPKTVDASEYIKRARELLPNYANAELMEEEAKIEEWTRAVQKYRDEFPEDYPSSDHLPFWKWMQKPENRPLATWDQYFLRWT